MRYRSTQTKGGRHVQSAPTAQSYTVPASVGGINALSSLTAMEPTDCISCINLVPSEYGLQLRKGYRDWATGMTGGAVNTVIGFEGQTDDASGKRLWAVTEDGIWDCTPDGTTVPIQDVVFSVSGAGAGFGVYTEMTNDAGNRYLFYADELNGLHMYTESSDTWSIPSITVATPANIAFCMVWKSRLWMIEKDSGDAYYLLPGAISGAATLFNFGAKLSHGGSLRSLYNWTIDGGNGVDDFLIAVGGGGDVLVYAGTDPDNEATFGLRGSYFIGQFPLSRRCGQSYGGEMYLLSTYGIISVRQLLEGIMVLDPSTGPSAKINRYLRQAVEDGIDSYVWAMEIYPADGFMQVIAPFSTGNRLNAVQYQQNLMTQAWGTWAGVPIFSSASWLNYYIMGTSDGRLIVYDGGTDEVTTEDPDGVNIDYRVLTSFQAPGNDATTFKQVSLIRPIQLSTDVVNLNVAPVYDYAIYSEIAAPMSTPPGNGTLWGSGPLDPNGGIWDVSFWSTLPSPQSFVRGGSGVGRTVAVIMRGNSGVRLTFIAWDISYTVGGFL